MTQPFPTVVYLRHTSPYGRLDVTGPNDPEARAYVPAEQVEELRAEVERLRGADACGNGNEP